jgi:hypothetical protein
MFTKTVAVVAVTAHEIEGSVLGQAQAMLLRNRNYHIRRGTWQSHT